MKTQGPSLSRRAVLNAAASSIDYAARIIVQFLVNPVLVSGLGPYLFGAWRVMWQLSGYLWAASGRSGQALQWVVAHRQASADDEAKRRLVGSALLVGLVFLPLLAVIGALLAWFAPELLDSPPRYVGPIRVTGLLLTLDAIALSLLSIPRAVLQGQNLGYKRMGMSAAMVAAGGGLMAVAVTLDLGIIGVTLAHLAGTIGTGILFWRVARRFVEWFGVARPTRATFRWFLGLSGWFTAWKYVYELIVASDVVVLGVFASVELVSGYVLTKAVPDAIIPLITIAVSGSAAGLGGIIGRGRFDRGVRIRNEIMTVSWLVATAVGATVLLWNRSFVGIWVGPRFFAGDVANLLIVAMSLQFVLISNDARVIDMTLAVRAKVLLAATSASLAIGLAVTLQRVWDDKIVGLCVGIITGRAVLTVAYPWLLGRLLQTSLLQQLRGAVRPAAATVIIFSITLWLGDSLRTDSWIFLIGAGTISLVLILGTASLIGLTSSQRRMLSRRVRQMIGRPAG